MNKFDFIFSTRFWALVIGAVMFYLKAKGWVGESEMILVNTILAGFITIKTIDKNTGEASIKSAELAGSVTTVSLPSTVTSVQASTDSSGAVAK
jgi:hypothetical protein